MKWLNQLLEGRTEQERLTLIAGAAVAVPLIIWLLLWQPLLAARDNAQTRLEQRRGSYVWMQQAASQLQVMCPQERYLARRNSKLPARQPHWELMLTALSPSLQVVTACGLPAQITQVQYDSLKPCQ